MSNELKQALHLLEEMSLYFKSANAIPVEKAYIREEEFEELKRAVYVAFVELHARSSQAALAAQPASAAEPAERFVTWHDKTAVLRSAWDALRWHCDNPSAADMTGMRMKADQRAALGLSSLINAMEEFCRSEVDAATKGPKE